MNFFRTGLFVLSVCGGVYLWENFGAEFFARNFQAKEIIENTPSTNFSKTAERIVKEEKKEAAETPTRNGCASFERGFADVVEKVRPSVVSVVTMQLIEDNEKGIPDIFKGFSIDDIFKDFFFESPKKKQKLKKANSLGSGFIVLVDKKNKKAYVATNEHVVKDAKKIVISLSDKTELPATVHAVDTRTDIAVLCVDLKNLDFDIERLRAVEWGDSDKLNEGNFVVAIGNPFGFGSTVTNGIVSAKSRSLAAGMPSLNFVDYFIQHSAPINVGNSGGCLLNVHGEVIGINNVIFSTTGVNIGIAFAIPSNVAKNTVEQLIKHKRTFRGWLGTEVQPVLSKQAESVGLTKHSLEPLKIFGAYVAKIVPNGPASKSGIKVGDIIIEFNGKKISENCSLQKAVGTAEIGKSVKLKVWRQKDNSNWGEVELSVTVGDFEKALKDGELDSQKSKEDGSPENVKELDIESLGITVSPIPAQHKDEYPKEANVVVTKVEEDDAISFYGSPFRPGDVIIVANNKRVMNTTQLKGIIDEVLKNSNNRTRPIPFVVIRDGAQMIIATTLNFSAKEKKKN